MDSRLLDAMNVSKTLEQNGALSGFKRSKSDASHEIRIRSGLIAIDGNPLITWDTFTYFWLPQFENDDILFAEWALQTKE